MMKVADSWDQFKIASRHACDGSGTNRSCLDTGGTDLRSRTMSYSSSVELQVTALVDMLPSVAHPGTLFVASQRGREVHVMAKIGNEYNFTVFVEEQEGAYIAHALEAGLLATANDCDTAISALSKMLVRHIEFAERNQRPDQIYHPSPQDVWQRFAQQREKGKAELFEKRSRVLAQSKLMLNQSAYATCG